MIEKNISDCIINLHDLARTIEDFDESMKVRLLADELAKIGNRLYEKTESTGSRFTSK